MDSYNTTSTLNSSGWSQSGTQTTTSFSQSYQEASGSGSFNLPASSGGNGWGYSGTTSEDNGQSASASGSASYTLDGAPGTPGRGNWQQTGGSGSNGSSTWQSSSQSGSYSHVVSGVTLSGSFSQSASQNDTSSYTSSGYLGSSGQWVSGSGSGAPGTPGRGSDTLTTSSSSSYSGSGSATATLSSFGLPASWVSSGTQSESASGSASASHTTYYSLGSDGSWQATSGSGTTTGSQTTLAGYSGSGSYTSYSGVSGSGGGSIQGGFSQAQSETTSWNFNTDDTYCSGSSGSAGYWQASDGSGSTVDSGGSSFSYSGSGSYGSGSAGGTMSQSGGASESFNYTKNYSIDGSGNWQVLPSTSGGGASGSGWTSSSYSASPTPYTTTVQGYVVTGTDEQGGGNSTSYSFQTTAVFNGIDWSETGSKTSSGSGETSDAYSAQASNLTFATAYGPASGSASANGGSTTSYSYTEQAFLDDNGTWQNGSGAPGTPGPGSSAGSGSVSVGGWQNWSLSASGPYQATIYGNSASGTQSANGNGGDSYQYSEYYQFGLNGQWQATSGSGSAAGGESLASGYAASGGCSNVPAWVAAPGSAWSGSVSAAANSGTSYDYSTNSTFTPGSGSGSGWTSTGSASCTVWGASDSSFTASSPFSSSGAYSGGGSIPYSGTASCNGGDNSSFSYTQSATLQADGSWAAASGSGSTSGGTSQNWSYAGGGSSSQTSSTASVIDESGLWTESQSTTSSGQTLAESGSQSFSMGYGTTATLASGASAWVQSGSGSASGNVSYYASYTAWGSGSDETDSVSGGAEGVIVNITSNASAGDMSESNVASGTSNYSDSMTLAGGVWTDDPSLSASTSSQSGYTSANTSSSSFDEPGMRDNGGYSSGNVTSNAIVTTTSNYNYGSNQWDSTTALSGSGQANWTGGAYYNNVYYPSEDTWSQVETNSSWSPLGSGTAVSETVSSTYAGYPAPDPAYSSSSAQYSLADFSQTGGLWVSGYPFELPTLGTSSGLTTGGTGFPGSGQTLGSIPAVPAIVSNFGTPTLPGAAGVTLLLSATPGSLAGIAPSPVLVGAEWGMAFTPQTEPQTAFAVGNTAGAAAGFTSETMVGAGGFFGANNVAVVLPVTDASIAAYYGFYGVSAGSNAPVMGDRGSAGFAITIVPTVGYYATPAGGRGSGANVRLQFPASSRGKWISGTRGNGTFRFSDTPLNRAQGLAGLEFQFEGGFIKPGGFPSNLYFRGSASAATVQIPNIWGTDQDNKDADKEMRKKLGPNWKRPTGYVWNHAGPPGSNLMELVDRRIHKLLSHTGSASEACAVSPRGRC